MIILIVFISLSILILVHELGHFLTAKFFGVRVDEFGIGFPPKIIGKKFGNTIYSINFLPFGGFVKIFGEDGDSAETLPLKNAVVSPQRGETPLGSPPAGRQVGLIRPAVAGHRARSASGTFSKTKLPSLGLNFSGISIWQRSLIVLAGVFMNIVLGWLALSVVFMAGATQHLAINGVQSNSPAAAVGLKEGDVILFAEHDGLKLNDPVRVDDFIALVKNARDDKINLQIQRGKEKLDVSLNGRINPPEGQGSLGVSLTEIGLKKESFF